MVRRLCAEAHTSDSGKLHAADARFLQVAAVTLRRAGADVRAVASAARTHELIKTWVPDVRTSALSNAQTSPSGMVSVETYSERSVGGILLAEFCGYGLMTFAVVRRPCRRLWPSLLL